MVKTAQLEGVRGGNMFINTSVNTTRSSPISVRRVTRRKCGSPANNVVGAQAAFLKDLQKRADDYTRNTPTTDDFAGGFFVSFVKVNHKKRERSALRSPFADSEYQDGYVIDVELKFAELETYSEKDPQTKEGHLKVRKRAQPSYEDAGHGRPALP